MSKKAMLITDFCYDSQKLGTTKVHPWYLLSVVEPDSRKLLYHLSFATSPKLLTGSVLEK